MVAKLFFAIINKKIVQKHIKPRTSTSKIIISQISIFLLFYNKNNKFWKLIFLNKKKYFANNSIG